MTPQLAHAMEFSFKFGSSGTGNDNLKSPSAVAVSSDGKTIYVADTVNNRINVFDNKGNYSLKFDNSETTGGKFNSPSGLVLDTSNNLLYVADTNNDRIQVFKIGDSTCPSNTIKVADKVCYVEKFGSNGTADGKFDSPMGLVLDTRYDLLYIADTANNRVQAFDEDYVFDDRFGSSGTGNDNLKSPSAVAVSSDGKTIYVADTDNDRINVFDNRGNYSFKFDTSGTSNGQFDSPSGLALDTGNNLLYVADTDNDRIQVFKLVDSTTCPSGTTKIIDKVCFVEKFGSNGTSNGQFDSPSGFALDTGNNLLYVADTDNDRIQVFKFTTNTSGSTGSSNTLTAPKNLKTSPISLTSVLISWDTPIISNDVPPVTGYKIEYKTGSDSYSVIFADTKSLSTSFIHKGLDPNKTYYYQVSAINSKGTSNPSSSSSIKPTSTTVPAALIATAISPTQIKLSWQPPSDTLGQTISGYEIKRVLSNGETDTAGQTNAQTTSYTISNLLTDKTYSYIVTAKIGYGFTNPSNTATATPLKTSTDTSSAPQSATLVAVTVPGAPIKLTATSTSSSENTLSWNPPSSDGNSPITGYKIEVKKDSGSYSTLVADTKSIATTYSHTNLTANSKYAYKVSAINSAGTSTASAEVTVTSVKTIKLGPLGKLTTDEGKPLSFSVKVTDSSLIGMVFSLENNPPVGAKINSNTGLFTWTPTDSQGSKSYVFDIVVKLDSVTDRQPITITVNDVSSTSPTPTPEPTKEPEPPKELGLASFVDKTKDPQSYVDRYNNEPKYKEWFDTNFSQYSSIYEAVGLEAPLPLASFVDKTKDPQSYVDRYNNEPKYKEWFDTNFSQYSSIYEAVGLEAPLPLASFVDKTKDPQSYVDRYNNEPKYKEWFDTNFSQYSSIYEAVGLDESKTPPPKDEKPGFGICGTGTKLINGICTIVEIQKSKPWWHFW